jgi:integrase
MSNPKQAARRVRVERNVYRRATGTFEVGYRDSTGRQRWQTVQGGILAARAVRDDLLGRKGKGERVQPNPKLRFGEAADKWLADQVSELRPATQAIYRNAIDTHLRKRWERKRLDTITADDAANLVRELRAEGKSEWTIAGVLKAAGRVFKFARRRMAWHGDNPVVALDQGERPKPGDTERRRIYSGDELEQTLAAAHEPYRTLFSLAAVTGARLSELLGLYWSDVTLSDLNAAEIRIEQQVDRQGKRQPLKTPESRRTVELPRSLATLLASHKLAAPAVGSDAFIFATRSGRPMGQRNVMRELRRTQTRARDARGLPTFPALQDLEKGETAPRGSVPSFHGFRHSAVSTALAAGEPVQEISWQLGHRNSVVTQAVYAQEIKSTERTARRRAAMEERYGSTLEALVRTKPPADDAKLGSNVAQLSQVAAGAN